MFVMSVAKDTDRAFEDKTDQKIKKRKNLQAALRKNLLRRKKVIKDSKDKNHEK